MRETPVMVEPPSKSKKPMLGAGKGRRRGRKKSKKRKQLRNANAAFFKERDISRMDWQALRPRLSQ